MVTMADCESGNLNGDELVLCREIVNLTDKFDDIQTQIYIISGAVGGVLLILIILVIALFVKLNSSFRRANGLNSPARGDELAKRGFATYVGPPIPQQIQSPPPPKPFGYDPVNNSTAGGVRVLPRNPPAPRNQNGHMEDGYY